MALTLRGYQIEAADAAGAAWTGGMQRPAVVLPTGAGKSVVIGEVVRRFKAEHPDQRALSVAHRVELVEQNADKIRSVAPDLRVGIVKAERNQTLADVVSASIQTLTSDARLNQLLNVGLVVIDECHHATSQSYLKVMQHLGCFDKRTHALGFTATMSRGDGKALGDVWQDIVYTKSILWMMDHNYLVRAKGKYVKVPDLDLSKLRKRGGDYSDASIGEAIEDSMAPEAIAKAYMEHAANRSGIVFAPTVATAGLIAKALDNVGLSTAVISGTTPKDERKASLKAFSAGEIQVLVNCMVLTEGTDLPIASCVVIARPTTSAALYIQMVGRVLRQHPPFKDDALVLDLVAASTKHALASPVQLFGDAVEIERDDEPMVVDEDAEELDTDQVTLATSGAMPIDPGYNGPTETVDVDLFHGSESAWACTRAGVWFLPAGERYIAIVPSRREPGSWDVVAMHRYQVGQSRYVVREPIADKGYAMAYAEGDVTEAEKVHAQRERSWRSKKPTPPQLEVARQHKIAVTDGMRRGELSTRISEALASKRIDPFLPSGARAR